MKNAKNSRIKMLEICEFLRMSRKYLEFENTNSKIHGLKIYKSEDLSKTL